MTSPAKFRKDKEIVAEYETQVKGKALFSVKKLKSRHCVVQGEGMCLEIRFLTAVIFP